MRPSQGITRDREGSDLRIPREQLPFCTIFCSPSFLLPTTLVTKREETEGGVSERSGLSVNLTENDTQ